MSNQNNQKKLPTQMMLMVRGFLALYLLYLASDMIKTEDTSDPRMIVIGSAVVFAIAGIILLMSLIRCFIKGEYEGGKADISEETSTEDEITADVIETKEEQEANNREND